MDELLTNRTLLQVVEAGSFSAASKKMNVSVATVARQVSSLEDRLGIKLLSRSTRSLSLTEAGHLYAERLRDVLHDFDTIKTEVTAFQKDVKGVLKLHLRHSVGMRLIVPALPQFLNEHPDLKVDVTLTDERVDLVANGIDVAVWLGKLDDSSLIMRKLNSGDRIICCSPGYAEIHGLPKTPEELANHNCMIYRARSYDDIWRLKSDGEIVSVNVSGNLETESAAVLFESAKRGVGLAMLQQSMVQRSIESGELINVFPGYEVASTDAEVALYAVYAGRKRIPPKTRAFVDFLVKLFRDEQDHLAQLAALQIKSPQCDKHALQS